MVHATLARMSHAGPPPPPPIPPTTPLGGALPPPPPPAPRSRALLWVVLGVLLAVLAAGAVTLVLVAPWDDDPPSRDAATDDAGEGDAEDERVDEGEPAEPPVVTDQVTGDRDGDGLGDAQFVLSESYGETYERWTFTSTGSGFESTSETEEWIPGSGQAFADWDGDGEPSVLAIREPVDNGESLSFTLSGDGLEDTAVDLPIDPDADKHVVAVAGDYDGDGRPDVAVATETSACEVTVRVLRGTGSGFEAPATWAVLTDTLTTETQLSPSDVDGDGDDDLLGVVPAGPLDADNCESGAWFGDYAGVVLTSDASGFAVGTRSEIDSDDLRDAVGGDFAGDGTPLVAVVTYGTSIRMLEHAGSGLTDAPDWTVDLGPALEAASTQEGTSEPGIEAVTVADVDGDGDDDLVVLAHDDRADLYYQGVWVVRSDGTGFGEPEKWADASDCGEFDSCSADPVTGSVFQ